MPNTFLLPSSRTVSIIVPMVFSGGIGAGVANVEVANWVSAAQANGGSPSTPFINALDKFVTTSKSNSTWPKLEEVWLPWADDAGSLRVALRSLRVGNLVGSPTHTPLRGLTCDGTTNYFDTLWVPSVDKVSATPTDMRVGAYARQQSPSNGSAIGSNSGSNRSIGVTPRLSLSATEGRIAVNSTAGVFTVVPASDGRGYLVGSRNGTLGTDSYVFKNGANLALTTVPSTLSNVTLSSVSFFIGGSNASGVLGAGYPYSVGYCDFGRYMTPSEEALHYAAVQQFATDIGAQV